MTTLTHWRDRIVCLFVGHMPPFRVAKSHLTSRFVICPRCGGTASHGMRRTDHPWGKPRGVR